ncbi:MAG: lytic transglycosylase domain-containing protein [Ignavibacteriaceae bacterium]|nr:lytic transglycosylase domain-containing protein [Ignavibacteriaceae bacterium]
MSEKENNKQNKSNLYFFFAGIAAAFLLIGAAVYFYFANNPETIAQMSDNYFPQGYKIISPQLPEKIFFAGERVPLENFEVKERIEREILVNTYWHSATILAIKRAGRWFPVIEPILKKNGIPEDFKYLAIAESNLDNVVSPANARGFWQFIDAAAQKYGLEVSSEVDERYDVIKSTEAACLYLKEAYEKFGSWTLAAASYNMGINGLDKQLTRQKARNYYNLVLGEETSRYIARIISLKLIIEAPAKFGYDISDADLYKPLKYFEVEVDTPIYNLADFSIAKGFNYKILKLYNPWLRDTLLLNKYNKKYLIKFPEKGSIEIIRD